MTGKTVDRGAIYHATSHHRREVRITDALRREVEQAIVAVRGMLAAGRMPPPVNDQRCRECSLVDLCQPAAVAAAERLARLRRELFVSDECST
jgi:CRISPR-associated exonuclease Cas4